MTLQELQKQYWSIKKRVKSYRYGQHFINTFIEDTSLFPELWEEKDFFYAQQKVHSILDMYNWDANNLKKVRNIEV